MRRSHVMLAAAVAIAGTAALLGSRSSSSAEVGTTAALAIPAVASSPGMPRVGAPAEAAPVASGPGAVAKRTAASLSELLDLSQLTLAGDHYEAVLKDGRHAVLTLDPSLQTYAEKLLAEARAPRGAIVAMAPDGRILALAGRRGEPPEKKNSDTKDGTFDWHLATDVWAPAASVFKLVTASALVAAGVTPDDKICFHGGLRSVLESNLHDDKRDSRCESLLYGVAHSNNAIVGKFAYQHLEPAALVKFSSDLGIAHGVIGDELTGSAGQVDIPPAHDLSFAQTAAGFAGSQLSAVGGALLAATFADDGEQPVPRVIASIDGAALPVPARRRAVPAVVAKAVSKMMLATCEMGSAAKSFGKHQTIHVAGKTGTLTRTEPFYMEHSWFVGYAPAENPQIVVSVVLGNPENWHLRGHEAARRLIDRAMGHDKDRTAKITSTRRVGW